MNSIITKIRKAAIALWKTSPWLTATGWLMIADFMVCLIAMCFDTRQITGVNAWLKPAKFGLSSAVTCLTLAWFAGYLKDWPKTRVWASRIFAVSIAIEIVVINLQAARGTTSHFNVSTPFNKAAFMTMGISICTLWLSMAALTVAVMRQSINPASWRWALRLGLLLSLVGAAGGGLMLRQTPSQIATPGRPLFGSHTVGAPDGGPGLPVANWSTQHGDLRNAHFLGLHAMQVIPLMGLWLLYRKDLSELQRTRFVWLACVAYAGVFALLTWQAERGQALLHPDEVTLTAAFVLLIAAMLSSAGIRYPALRTAVNRWVEVVEVRV